MAGNFDDLDIELFIDEVKMYPEIWNIAAENYHDRTKKRGAWVNVCRVFCEGFNEKDDKDKNEICNTLIKKWRNIRDNYMKSLKKKPRSGQAVDSRRRYIYDRQLSFLQTAGATTETQSSLTNDNDEDEVLEQSSDEQPRQNKTQPEQLDQTRSYNQSSSRKRKRDIESSLIDFMNTPIPSVAAVPEPNADRSFFESILPSISNFTEDQKLEFRSEILNLIKQMRMSSQPQNSNISYSTPLLNVPSSIPQSSYYWPKSQRYQSSTQLTPTTHSSNYLPQIHYQQPSKQFTELQIRPTSLSQAHFCGQNVNTLSPSTLSSTSVDNQVFSKEDTMDIIKEGLQTT